MIYPSDCEQAYDVFGANCGPASIAAILNRNVMDIRSYLDGFEQRKYMNPTHVKATLDKMRIGYKVLGTQMPINGLVFIQWGGHENKPITAQYRFTHWIAIEYGTVFEVNAPQIVTWQQWQKVMPGIIKEEGHGNGSFFIRSALEIVRHGKWAKAYNGGD